eukprot:8991343-Ditylum_brightwellii.AAC.1
MKVPNDKTNFQVINQTLANKKQGLSGYDIFKVTVDFCDDDVRFAMMPIKSVKDQELMAAYSYTMQYLHHLPKLGRLESSNSCINHTV